MRIIVKGTMMTNLVPKSKQLASLGSEVTDYTPTNAKALCARAVG